MANDDVFRIIEQHHTIEEHRDVGELITAIAAITDKGGDERARTQAGAWMSDHQSRLDLHLAETLRGIVGQTYPLFERQLERRYKSTWARRWLSFGTRSPASLEDAIQGALGDVIHLSSHCAGLLQQHAQQASLSRSLLLLMSTTISDDMRREIIGLLAKALLAGATDGQPFITGRVVHSEEAGNGHPRA